MTKYKRRRIVLAGVLLLVAAISAVITPNVEVGLPSINSTETRPVPAALSALEVKGRAPKTGYERSQFGDRWEVVAGCDMRNTILLRDLKDTVVDERCKVIKGTLIDPYTATVIQFTRGETTSDDVQIDHVVSLSDAWQKGAQQLSYESRVALANDPLNLLAVEGSVNQQKSDSDAATWLPPNKDYRCDYVRKQISVKQKYSLWVTTAERDAMATVLGACTTP